MEIAFDLFQDHMRENVRQLKESMQSFSEDDDGHEERITTKFFEDVIGEFNGSFSSESDQLLKDKINKVYLDWWTGSFNEWKRSKGDVQQLLNERIGLVKEDFSKISLLVTQVDTFSEMKPSKCQHVLSRGVRKGDFCGKTTSVGLVMCTSHSKSKVQLLSHVHPEPLLESVE
jgi:hypothetical protein